MSGSYGLALKGVLRLVNIDPPNWHDAGIVLKRNVNRFPDWFQEQIDELAMISRDLYDERERSMYGDESLGTVARDLYTKKDANTALLSADKLVGDCQKLIKDVEDRNEQD